LTPGKEKSQLDDYSYPAKIQPVYLLYSKTLKKYFFWMIHKNDFPEGSNRKGS
jgi:hypothetical protein